MIRIKNEALNKQHNEGMFLNSVVKCAIVISLTQLKFTQCHPSANNNRTPSNGSLIEASLITADENVISGHNVALNDNSSSLDNSSIDSRQRGFPTAAKRKKHLFTPYHDIDYSYGDYGIIPATAEELPDCILSSSEYYLSWWVNEDGSLRMPATRPGGSVGFVDLSLEFHSEDMIFNHVTTMQTDNPNDVIVGTFISHVKFLELVKESFINYVPILGFFDPPPFFCYHVCMEKRES